MSLRRPSTPASAAFFCAISIVAAGCGSSNAEVSRVDLPTFDNVVRDPTDVPPPVTRTAPRHVHVHLVAREVAARLSGGERYVFWTYQLAGRDGRPAVPGPMIRVLAGDTLSVTLTNDARNLEPHGIDFHAAIGPGGGTDMTEVKPGETRTFTFKTLRPGAYVYHCGTEGKP